jgi:hypothetical protein
MLLRHIPPDWGDYIAIMRQNMSQFEENERFFGLEIE